MCGVALVISKSGLDSKDGLMARGQCQRNLGLRGMDFSIPLPPAPARICTAPARAAQYWKIGIFYNFYVYVSIQAHIEVVENGIQFRVRFCVDAHIVIYMLKQYIMQP